MRVTVNGTPRDLPPDITVAELLSALGLEGGRLVVEHNRAILPRERFAETRISEGDNLELVEIVGGG